MYFVTGVLALTHRKRGLTGKELSFVVAPMRLRLPLRLRLRRRDRHHSTSTGAIQMFVLRVAVVEEGTVALPVVVDAAKGKGVAKAARDEHAVDAVDAPRRDRVDVAVARLAGKNEQGARGEEHAVVLLLRKAVVRVQQVRGSRRQAQGMGVSRGTRRG